MQKDRDKGDVRYGKCELIIGTSVRRRVLYVGKRKGTTQHRCCEVTSCDKGGSAPCLSAPADPIGQIGGGSGVGATRACGRAAGRKEGETVAGVEGRDR